MENTTNNVEDGDEEYIKNDLNDKEDAQLRFQEKIYEEDES